MFKVKLVEAYWALLVIHILDALNNSTLPQFAPVSPQQVQFSKAIKKRKGHISSVITLQQKKNKYIVDDRILATTNEVVSILRVLCSSHVSVVDVCG